MNGWEMNGVESIYFRKAIEATLHCAGFSLCNRHTFFDTHVQNVYTDTESRVHLLYTTELLTYGGCQMGDGATGTRSIPFINYSECGLESASFHGRAHRKSSTLKDASPSC